MSNSIDFTIKKGSFMFINVSNISSTCWGKKQLQETVKYGKIVDINFPVIFPECSDDLLYDIAHEIKEQIKEYSPKKGDCVCIAAEYGITFDIVDYVHSCLNYVVCVYPVMDNDKNFIKFRLY